MRYNITVTSDWTEYLEYVSWRKGVEAQIWNNSMSVTQKLDAAKSYLKTNYRYGSSGVKYIAYKTRNFAFNNRILRFAGCTLGKTEDSIF